jgi:hypothetical protein
MEISEVRMDENVNERFFLGFPDRVVTSVIEMGNIFVRRNFKVAVLVESASIKPAICFPFRFKALYS